MSEKQDEKPKSLYCKVTKDWKFSGELIIDFVRSRIGEFKREGKWKSNFDDEEIVKRFVDVVEDIGVGFDAHLGYFGREYFFRILNNLTVTVVIEEMERQRKSSDKKLKKEVSERRGGEK